MSNTPWIRVVRLAVVMFPVLVSAQAARAPREFPEFRGTWVIDQAASRGNLASMTVARTVTITTTPAAITVVRDRADPDVYFVDGSESRVKDLRTGAPLNRWLRFTLVAEDLALTSKVNIGERSQITTEGYHIDGNVLTVERQVSSLSSGALVTPEDVRNTRQTLVYRRDTQALSR